MRKNYVNKRKYAHLTSPPIDYWFTSSLLLILILFFLLILLIQERSFLPNAQFYLDKYKIILNDYSNLNAKILASRLYQPINTLNFSSSSKVIYISPENFSYKIK